jgi:hypothetical protein
MWLKTSRFCLICLGVAFPASQGHSQEFLIQDYIFNINHPQEWWEPLLKNLGSPEAQAAATAVATYYGVNASTAVALVQAAINNVSRTQPQDQYGFFPVPVDGYTFCRAERLNFNAEDNPDHRITMNLRSIRQENQDGVAYYTVVPSGTSLQARIRVIFVKANAPRVVQLTNAGRCQAHNVCPMIHGPGGTADNYRDCDPNDRRLDRWLDGRWGCPVRYSGAC